MKIAGRCLIAVGIIMGIIFYYFYAFNNFHEVVEKRIYRSAQLSEKKLKRIIVKKKLKSIINLRGKTEGKKWYEMEKKIAEDNGIQYYSFRFVAHSLPNCTQLDALIEAFKAAPRPLLLHCKGGADRTGLASALVLAIEKNSPLSELKQQFSMLYGVIPFTGSTGHLLFSQYENWLNKNGSSHDRDVLLYWIKNFYVDNKGNIEFVIDVASGIEFNAKKNGEKRVVTLRPLPKTISVHGWAFDRRRNTHIAELSVVIPNHVSKKADLGIIRPDVAKVFKLKREAFPDFKVGWGAVFDSSALPVGCHDIFLKVRIKGGKLRYVATDCRLCIKG